MSSVNIKRRKRPGARLVIAVPFMWLFLLVLIPFFIVFKISFAEQALQIPPFTPLFDEQGNMHIVWQNYKDIFADFGSSLWAMIN